MYKALFLCILRICSISDTLLLTITRPFRLTASPFEQEQHRKQPRDMENEYIHPMTWPTTATSFKTR
jgi:hypothetical protein